MKSDLVRRFDSSIVADQMMIIWNCRPYYSNLLFIWTTRASGFEEMTVEQAKFTKHFNLIVIMGTIEIVYFVCLKLFLTKRVTLYALSISPYQWIKFVFLDFKLKLNSWIIQFGRLRFVRIFQRVLKLSVCLKQRPLRFLESLNFKPLNPVTNQIINPIAKEH